MKLLFILLLTASTFVVHSQTYATEALRKEAETNQDKKGLKRTSSNSLKGIYIKKESAPLNQKSLKNTFQLVKIEAIDYTTKHSKEEMLNFNLESQQEFNKTDIRISSKLDKIYFISKENNKEYSAKDIVVVNNVISYLNCLKCSDFKFSIVSNKENELILETPAQDEGKYYTTRLILKK
ncbi:MAG: hypothetical protein ACPGVH_10105 [Chitinophagales bacterium]